MNDSGQAVEFRTGGLFMKSKRRRCCRLVPAALIVFGLVVAASAAFADGPLIGLRVDGTRFTGALADLTIGGDVVFHHGDTLIRIPSGQLVTWGAYQDRYQSTQLVLRDGSRLVAEILRIESDQIVIAGRVWAECAIPLSQVRAVVLRAPAGNLQRDQLFDRLQSLSSDQDRLILENGDELVGRLVTPVQPEPGGFNPIAIKWQIADGDGAVQIPLDRVVALVPHRASGVSQVGTGKVVVLGFDDGSCLLAENISHKGGTLTIGVCGTVRLEIESGAGADPWRRVVSVQPLMTDIIYLSDLKPLGYKHIPYLATEWPYRIDRSVSGGRLRRDGNIVWKGLGMHSSARLAYELPRSFRWLQAELAIDQRASNSGSVVYRVYLQDAQEKWSLAYESPIVRGNDRVISMQVDVHAAQRIALIVDFADQADVWDHANWLNARLIP